MIEAIYIRRSPGGPLEACDRVEAVAGKGLRGDRHYGADDEPGQNVTLVEAEEIEAFCDRHGLPRDLALTARNLVTRGVRLDDLVGRTFQVGTVRLRGVERCEPCLVLGRRLAREGLDAPRIVREWAGRGGLRADVLDPGEIRPGDRVVPAAA